MIVLNFAHPFTDEHIRRIEEITGSKVERVVEIPPRLDTQQPLVPQVVDLVDRCGLTPTEWQTLPLLINPPSLNFIAVVLLAELHGRCGYFPHASLGCVPMPGKHAALRAGRGIEPASGARRGEEEEIGAGGGQTRKAT